MEKKAEGQPHAKATSDARESRMRGEDSEGYALSIACHAERSLPDGRAQETGALNGDHISAC